MKNFIEITFYFIVMKEFWYDKNSIKDFLDNLSKHFFFNIVVNVNFFVEYYCERNPEILLQISLKYETKTDGKEKVTEPWNI